MDQQLINVLLGGSCALLGAILKTVWDSIKDLQVVDRGLVDRVSHVEVLVAGSYVKREEFDKLAAAIFRKLDAISDKLDGKADK